MKQPANIWKAFSKIPPVVCRLVARKNRGRIPLSNEEIAERSGIPASTVALLSLRKSWHGVDVDVACRFAMACGVNHLSARRHVEFFKRSRRGFAAFSRGNQQQFFLRLLKIATTLDQSDTALVRAGCADASGRRDMTSSS